MLARVVAFALIIAAIPATAQEVPSTEALPLDVCNRSSFAADAAIGLEVSSGAATQGWFRVFPGQCREILRQGLGASRHLMHVRPLKVYGTPPATEASVRRLCVRDENFVIAGAAECASDGQYMAEFVAVQPIIVNDRRQIAIDEPAGFDSAGAITAGLQRLLSLAGFDVGTIDGIEGTRTENAIDRYSETSGVSRSDPIAMMAALVERIENGQATAAPQFCNETLNRIMLSVGISRGAAIETRGWYEIASGECARPVTSSLAGDTLYAFAEAVDAAGAPLLADGRPIAWQGDKMLCTKNLEFSLRDHRTCEERGLSTRGFRSYTVPDTGPLIVSFDDPTAG